MSRLALQLIQQAKQNQSKTLDLTNCGLSEIPPAVFELIWLEALIFSDYYQWNQKKKVWIEVKSQNQGKENKISNYSPHQKNLQKPNHSLLPSHSKPFESPPTGCIPY